MFSLFLTFFPSAIDGSVFFVFSGLLEIKPNNNKKIWNDISYPRVNYIKWIYCLNTFLQIERARAILVFYIDTILIYESHFIIKSVDWSF